MAPIILADTSVLIGLQRGQTSIIRTFSKLYPRLRISRISACEFIYGSRSNEEKEINQQFFHSLPILELNTEISITAYQLMDEYTLSTHLGVADALIAATTIVYRGVLWTENLKHFSKIKSLNLYH